MMIGRLPRQPHERVQARAHRAHAIDQALTRELSTAGSPARAVRCQERVQLSENPFIGRRRLRDNRAERGQQFLVQQSPVTARGPNAFLKNALA
jgi:hypothetical protein